MSNGIEKIEQYYEEIKALDSEYPVVSAFNREDGYQVRIVYDYGHVISLSVTFVRVAKKMRCHAYVYKQAGKVYDNKQAGKVYKTSIEKSEDRATPVEMVGHTIDEVGDFSSGLSRLLKKIEVSNKGQND